MPTVLPEPLVKVSRLAKYPPADSVPPTAPKPQEGPESKATHTAPRPAAAYQILARLQRKLITEMSPQERLTRRMALDARYDKRDRLTAFGWYG